MPGTLNPGTVPYTLGYIDVPVILLPSYLDLITLDADTLLPRDSARRLIATLAHPLNRAEFDPESGAAVAGYTVLQPRVEVKPTSAGRSLFVLDLAVPRDFDPAVGDRPEVYLYSIDDLKQACERNRRARDKQLPAARKIIDQETRRFMADLHHRSTGPVIHRLRQGWQKPKEQELERLLNKLPDLDQRARDEIRQSFDRLINKLLHHPTVRIKQVDHSSSDGIAMLEAVEELFHLNGEPDGDREGAA